jgi:hypothetical protein
MSDQVGKYVEDYVTSSVQSFLGDPPDSEFQFGFLGAMLVVAKEALGLRMDLPPFAEAERLLTRTKAVVTF